MAKTKERTIRAFRYAVIAFDHPAKENSVLYRKGVGILKLQDDMMAALEKGANIFSIRIYPYQSPPGAPPVNPALERLENMDPE